MPVDRVFLESVVGRQIETAAEPPHRGLPRPFRDEETPVGVGRRDVGVVRMQDQRNTNGFEAAARELRP